MIDDLYSAKVLKLVANIRHTGRLPAPDASSEKVSKLCGSRIIVDVNVSDGRVSDFAQEVRACALGQAAAAVLGAHVIGATPDEIEMARNALRAMLKANGPAPEGRFSELSVLEAVKDYPARHASTMLAFEAAAEAARTAVQARTSRTSRAGAA
ncbi:MAG TPA: iron-sulfur cluster assembly scaffold protein [Caulobacteraceae bacterium]|nr:iron-sulfur cluster assembly scaffold protein [Caulobacteraceae bacterium]